MTEVTRSVSVESSGILESISYVQCMIRWGSSIKNILSHYLTATSSAYVRRDIFLFFDNLDLEVPSRFCRPVALGNKYADDLSLCIFPSFFSKFASFLKIFCFPLSSIFLFVVIFFFHFIFFLSFFFLFLCFSSFALISFFFSLFNLFNCFYFFNWSWFMVFLFFATLKTIFEKFVKKMLQETCLSPSQHMITYDK